MTVTFNVLMRVSLTLSQILHLILIYELIGQTQLSLGLRKGISRLFGTELLQIAVYCPFHLKDTFCCKSCSFLLAFLTNPATFNTHSNTVLEDPFFIQSEMML